MSSIIIKALETLIGDYEGVEGFEDQVAEARVALAEEKKKSNNENPDVTLEVMIIWSENKHVAEFACEGKEDVFHPIDKINRVLRLATDQVLLRDSGYDKTKFTLRITENKTGETHEYTGRIDCGNDTHSMFHVVQQHIIEYCDYCLSDKADIWNAAQTESEKAEFVQWKEWMLHSMKL